MTETIQVPHPQAPTPSTTFPQEIEVSLILKIPVVDQEERNSWLQPDTNVITIDALADIGDILQDNDIFVSSINNLTKDQIREALATRTS